MLRKVTVLLLVFCTSWAMAQNSITHRILLPDPSRKSPCFWYIQDSILVDTMSYRIFYRLTFLPDTTKTNTYTTVMICEVGRKYIHYYSLAQSLSNIVQTKVIKKMREKASIPGTYVHYDYSDDELKLQAFAGNSDYINDEIWLNHQQHTLKERAADYARDNLAHEYEERMPALAWTNKEESARISEYLCYTASSHFGNRQWNVWYTPEIPLPFGPWKLGGLPGLILKAMDGQGHYLWECCGIETVCIPMSYYVIPTIKHTKIQFDKWLKHVHTHPYEVIDGGRGDTQIQTLSTGGLVDLDNTWSIPYNPIERE